LSLRDPPENGEEFKNFLAQSKKDQELMQNKNDNGISKNQFGQNSIFTDNLGILNNVRFSVFGLGNSSYPKFCSYGIFLDATLECLGADRINELGIGDELNGQEVSFKTWSIDVYKSALKAFCIEINNAQISSLLKDDSLWSAQTVRLSFDESNVTADLCANLSKLHGRNILPCKFLRKKNLIQHVKDRKTLLVELNTEEYSSDFEYSPGDHIGIFAANRKELIDKILVRLVDIPETDFPLKIEVLREKNTVFGKKNLKTKFKRSKKEQSFSY
jgi:nitric-oxide synthase, brain